jgi:hypothetical protein
MDGEENRGSLRLPLSVSVKRLKTTANRKQSASSSEGKEDEERRSSHPALTPASAALLPFPSSSADLEPRRFSAASGASSATAADVTDGAIVRRLTDWNMLQRRGRRRRRGERRHLRSARQHEGKPEPRR